MAAILLLSDPKRHLELMMFKRLHERAPTFGDEIQQCLVTSQLAPYYWLLYMLGGFNLILQAFYPHNFSYTDTRAGG